MKKDSIAVTIEGFLENLHDNQVLINGFSCLLVDAAELELVIGHFVVLGLEGNANL